MATRPLHEDTAGRFTRTQYEERSSLPTRPAAAGSEAAAEASTTYRQPYTGARRLKRRQRPQAIPSSAVGRLPLPVPPPIKQLAKHTDTITGIGKATGTTIAIAGWTTAVWFIVSFMSFISLLLAGAVYVVQDMNLARRVINGVIGAAAYMLDWPQLDLTVIFLICWAVQIILVLLMAAGAVAHYTVARVRSLSGSNGGLKKITFLFGVILNILPGGPILFNWLWIWMIVVASNPK